MKAAAIMEMSAPVPAWAITSGTITNTDEAGVAADRARNSPPRSFMLRPSGLGASTGARVGVSLIGLPETAPTLADVPAPGTRKPVIRSSIRNVRRGFAISPRKTKTNHQTKKQRGTTMIIVALGAAALLAGAT